MSKTNGAGEAVQDVVQDVAEELGELGRDLRKKGNEVRKQAVKQLHTAAETIRREAREATKDREAHKAADEVARGLEKAATYLNTHSLEDMGVEAQRVVKRNPLRTVFIAFAIGLLLGMFLRGDRD